MDSAWLCNYSHPIVLQAVDKIGKTLITSEVGMTFQSEDKAYEMYDTYVDKDGFSIRKSYIKRREDKTICQKYGSAPCSYFQPIVAVLSAKIN